MNAHTPGPWVWEKEDNVRWDGISPLGEYPDLIQLFGVDPLQHCVLSGSWHNDSTAGIALVGDNPEADARLIAAAPELLEALESVCNSLRSALRGALDRNLYFSEAAWLAAIESNVVLVQAKAAIQKARGGQ